MQRFFQVNLIQDNIALSEEESKHAVRVLRLKKGDQIELIDGLGTLAHAVITDDHPKRTLLEIKQREQIDNVRNYYLHLIISPAKNPDRNDWLVEKAVESGVDKISFIETANTERTRINIERLNKIAVSALKQSKQYYLPQISGLKSFEETLNSLPDKTPNECRSIAWCEQDKSHSFTFIVNESKASQFTVFIGPEGDFNKDEIAMAKSKGFIPVSLGSSILRTETAGLFITMALRALKVN